MPPSSIGKQVALRFLRNYAHFGSRGHLIAARAIQEKFLVTSDLDDKKVLAAKIYGEFIAAMENLAALCIAIRHRDDSVGLVYNYLTYGQPRKPGSPKTTLRQIYNLALPGNGLEAALRLPALTEIIRSASELANTNVPQLYNEVNILLAQAANAYLLHNSAFVRAYNKTKHGFVVVSDGHIFQPDPAQILPDACWIVGDNPEYNPDKRAEGPTPVVEIFMVQFKDVDPMVERIGVFRGAVVTLCELTALLLERDIITSADDRA